ncbi:MAG: hypothetical protein Q7J74_04880, partial [Pseudomonas sp.]|nr:hypothetical protein [Pseudomonas sp.]
GLSQMIGSDIDVTSLTLRRVPVTEISNLFGGPDTEAVGIYLTVSGGADGHLMLMYEPRIACAFIDMLMGQPPTLLKNAQTLANIMVEQKLLQNTVDVPSLFDKQALEQVLP